MKSIKLEEGVEIPVVGFGTWQLQGEVASGCVSKALEVGYRHIDTADRYGNHAEVGQAIKNSGLARPDIFLTTKLWREDLHAKDVRQTVDRFLSELDTDYIDLLLIHWPNSDIPLSETLQAMEECKQTGKLRAIGVSNFTERHLKEVLQTGTKVVNNQIEVRPRFNQQALRRYCHEHDISVTAYSSLRAGDMELPEVQTLAAKYNKQPAQIIINWLVSRGMIALPQSTKPERIKANFESIQFKMDETDLLSLDNVTQEERFNDPEFGEFD